MNLKERSNIAELLDGDDFSRADLEVNLREIRTVNRWLGGFKISCKGFDQLAGQSKKIHIVEIGCGNGDNLEAIANYGIKKGIEMRCTGIDIKEGCILLAQKKTLPNAGWICSDYREVNFAQKPDIIFSSLFCHHFSNEQIALQLGWMKSNAAVGFFINDLQRHFLAYHSIRLLGNLFSRSYLFKHDAPLSVARSFTQSDWQQIIKLSGIQNIQINWKWAFRYLVWYQHNES